MTHNSVLVYVLDFLEALKFTCIAVLPVYPFLALKITQLDFIFPPPKKKIHFYVCSRPLPDYMSQSKFSKI